jgi:hypothetical protein
MACRSLLRASFARNPALSGSSSANRAKERRGRRGAMPVGLGAPGLGVGAPVDLVHKIGFAPDDDVLA